MDIGSIALAVCGPTKVTAGKFDDGKAWRSCEVAYLGGKVKVALEEELHTQVLGLNGRTCEMSGLADAKGGDKGAILVITRCDRIICEGREVFNRSKAQDPAAAAATRRAA